MLGCVGLHPFDTWSKNCLHTFFDTSDVDPVFTTLAQTSKKRQKKTDDEPRKGVCCAQCLAQVTTADAAIEMQSAHRHTFTNPAGVIFDIRLFSVARCLLEGPIIFSDSWFSGYGWRIVTCRDCRQHLGWSYQRDHSPDFYGLIADALIEFKND